LIRNGSDKSGENYSRSQPTDFVNNLFEAAKDGKLSSVIYLLANGTNVNSKDPSNNRTALHYASEYNHLSVVEYLVNQKAEVNAKDSSIIESLLFGLLSIMQVHLVIVVLLNF